MGTLKLNTTSGGSVSIQAADGASDNTVTLPAVSGANIITSADSGTVTNAMIASGVRDNTPYFFGKLASNQTLTRATLTKITGLTSGEIDSASAFDGTTFTVPSGQGGIYFIFSLMTGAFDTVGNDGENIISYIYKNGSAQALSRLSHVGSGRDISYASVQHSFMLSLNAGDTVEMYGYLVDSTGSDAYVGTASTYFGGYKIN